MDRATFESYVAAGDLSRLRTWADVVRQVFDRPSSFDSAPPPDRVQDERLTAMVKDLDAIVVCHGAPRISAAILAQARRLTFIGELEGDRFARRVDVRAAAERGIRVVDTTHASSPAVAEWALALALIGLRDGGRWFRQAIADDPTDDRGILQIGPDAFGRELTESCVGLIGLGFIGRRLLDLLRPFRVTAIAYDPFAPRELGDAYDVTFTTLDRVMSAADVIVCLAPLTKKTRRMIGAAELALLRPRSVFVNVSRGAVVDSAALIERLRHGDVTAALDVFDPEPIPHGSPLRSLPNVFISPHIAGVTLETTPRFFATMVDELQRHFEGDEPVGIIDERVLANRST